MNNKCVPCGECRKQRRKCIRQATSARCSRCERLDRVCQQPIERTQAEDEDYDIKEFELLQNEAVWLEEAIQKMEQEMKSMSCNDSQLIPIRAQQQLPLLLRKWTVKIKDGSFVIETDIKSISDLLQLSPAVSYLSPFSSSNSTKSSIFDTDSSIFGTDSSIFGTDNSTFSVDSGNAYYDSPSLVMSFGREGFNCLMTCVADAFSRTMNSRPVREDEQALLPQILTLEADKFMRQLIDIYFTCHNLGYPMLYERQYRERIAQLSDITNDLVTLAICSFVCALPCRHLKLTVYEKKEMANFFYSKAKSVLFDQLEEADSRLENVMGISLLIFHSHMFLKLAEARQLIYIADQIIIDLQEHFQKHITEESRVDFVLYTRTIALLRYYGWYIDYITNNLTENSCPLFPTWEPLPDESEELLKSIRAQNIVISFYNQPVIHNYLKQIAFVYSGKTFNVAFEYIIQLEGAVYEWAKSLPEEFQPCFILKDLTMCKNSIDLITDAAFLKSFIEIQTMFIMVHASLTNPVTLHEEGQELLNWVKARSRQEVSRSCELLIYAACCLSRINSSSCHIAIVSDFLFQTIDVLGLLVTSTDRDTAAEAKQMMKRCLEEINNLQFIHRHKGASSSSFWSAMFSGTEYDIEHYDEYPHPWIYMMYDASQFLLSQ